MFASKTPRDLTSHAATICGRCDAEFAEDGIYSEDEHRDYHQPAQHNEPNPILVAFRADDAQTHNWPRAILIQDWIDVLDGFSNAWDSCAVDLDDVLDASTPWHRAHARRVLTRLANLAQNGELA